MPEQTTVRVLYVRILRIVEAIIFTLTLDTKDMLYLVTKVMSMSARLFQICGQFSKFGGALIQWCHLLHPKAVELSVEKMKLLSLRIFPTLRVFHDIGGQLHVGQCFEKLYFSLG